MNIYMYTYKDNLIATIWEGIEYIYRCEKN